VPGRPDINHQMVPQEGHCFIFHESPGFGPGDGQNLQAIRDFITNRTDQDRANVERLHAVR